MGEAMKRAAAEILDAIALELLRLAVVVRLPAVIEAAVLRMSEVASDAAVAIRPREPAHVVEDPIADLASANAAIDAAVQRVNARGTSGSGVWS